MDIKKLTGAAQMAAYHASTTETAVANLTRKVAKAEALVAAANEQLAAAIEENAAAQQAATAAQAALDAATPADTGLVAGGGVGANNATITVQEG